MTSSQKIIEYLRENLGDDLKLLLTPYKRDMWDSLEGVYREAKRQGWRVDVLPLPYTYRNSAREFTEWLIDDWTDIDSLIHEKPVKGAYDAILFHNPYDMCNLVTSVHPSYYTDQFKGLSRALCLVPYGIGNKCELWAGIINADIVFSENVEVVADAVMKAEQAGLTGIALEHFRRKFVVVGSTKCDVIFEQPVPDDWKEKIKGKRVILFATSLVPLLVDTPGEIKKYARVLQELSPQDNSVLIWREHPLTLGTLRAMRPEFEEEYRRMKDEVITKGDVIIDTTNDYRIAFSVADVLYCVPSSLVSVWKTTGKEFHRV